MIKDTAQDLLQTLQNNQKQGGREKDVLGAVLKFITVFNLQHFMLTRLNLRSATLTCSRAA